MVLVAALTALRVPVATVLDFDALNSEHPLRRIIEAYGRDWEDFEPNWTVVKSAVESKSVFVGGREFAARLTKIAKECDQDASVPKQVLSEIKKLARNASPWERAKDSGISAIPPGELTLGAQRLLKKLSDVGIFIAPKGEMEGFCRSISGHGPRWVEEVRKRDLEKDRELDEARVFVHEINRFLKGTRERLSSEAK